MPSSDLGAVLLIVLIPLLLLTLLCMAHDLSDTPLQELISFCSAALNASLTQETVSDVPLDFLPSLLLLLRFCLHPFLVVS